MLVTVVQRALNQNLDLDAARARVRQARAAASRAAATFTRLPTSGPSATFEHQSLRSDFGSVAAGSPGFKRDGHEDVVGPFAGGTPRRGGLAIPRDQQPIDVLRRRSDITAAERRLAFLMKRSARRSPTTIARYPCQVHWGSIV
jgi:outer membrane protein TolC